MQLIQRVKHLLCTSEWEEELQREPTLKHCGRSCGRDGGGRGAVGLSGEQPSQTSWVFSYILVLMTYLVHVHVSAATLGWNATQREDGQD